MSDMNKTHSQDNPSALAPENEHYLDFAEATRRRLAESPALRWAFEAERLKLMVATALDQLRELAGLSQKELAKKSGTTQPMLSRFFGGDDPRSPTLETLVKIADALGKQVQVTFVERHEEQNITWSKPRLIAEEQPAGTWFTVVPPAIPAETTGMAVPVEAGWSFQRASTGAAIYAARRTAETPS